MTKRRMALLGLLLFGVVTTSAPLVLFRYIPTQDGADHFNTGLVLSSVLTDPRSFFHTVVDFRSGPVSGQFAARLIAWFASLGAPEQAGHLAWLSFFALCNAVIVVNLNIMGEDALIFALLLFPIEMGYVVNMGLLNFLFGYVAFIQSAFLIQFGLRRPSWVWAVSLLAASVTTYLAHPLAGLVLATAEGAFAVAAGAVFVLSPKAPAAARPSRLLPLACALGCLLVITLGVADEPHQGPRFVELLRRALPTGAAAGAGVLDGVPAGVPQISPAARLFRGLMSLSGLNAFISYNAADTLFALSYAAIIAWLTLARGRAALRGGVRGGLRLEDLWLGPILALPLLSLLVGTQFEYYLPDRIAVCELCLVALWLSSTPLARAERWALLLLGVVLCLSLTAWRLRWSDQIERVLNEYAEVGAVMPDRAKAIAVHTSDPPTQTRCSTFSLANLPCRFTPTLHMLGASIGSRPIANVSNYQLRPESGFFPLILRPPWDAYTGINWTLEHWPQSSSNAAPLAAATALIVKTPPDVIVTWDEEAAMGVRYGGRPPPGAPPTALYTEIFQSRPLGAGRVYLRRGLAAAPASWTRRSERPY